MRIDRSIKLHGKKKTDCSQDARFATATESALVDSLSFCDSVSFLTRSSANSSAVVGTGAPLTTTSPSSRCAVGRILSFDGRGRVTAGPGLVPEDSFLKGSEKL
jgi:hypothetical protein